MKYLPLTLYAATIFGANWAITTFGLVPVGFGLMAPAAVYVAGLAFGLRDWTQETLGKRWVLAGIAAGGLLSLFVSAPAVAVASALAFLVSELADFAVYTPLRRRGLIGAVLASNAVGLVIDSALFLWLAFGSLDFLAGQVVGKTWVTLATVLAIWLWRWRCPIEVIP